jgi:DNA-directed RNA polymerase specialized sigma24 family protein
VETERERAFIAIHRDSYPRIYKYVRRRVESAEFAEELAADVFRVVWQKWGDQPPRTDIAFLLTVARNLIGNAYRSRERLQALQAKLRASAELRSGAESEVKNSAGKTMSTLQLVYDATGGPSAPTRSRSKPSTR